MRTALSSREPQFLLCDPGRTRCRGHRSRSRERGQIALRAMLCSQPRGLQPPKHISAAEQNMTVGQGSGTGKRAWGRAPPIDVVLPLLVCLPVDALAVRLRVRVPDVCAAVADHPVDVGRRNLQRLRNVEEPTLHNVLSDVGAEGTDRCSAARQDAECTHWIHEGIIWTREWHRQTRTTEASALARLLRCAHRDSLLAARVPARALAKTLAVISSRLPQT